MSWAVDATTLAALKGGAQVTTKVSVITPTGSTPIPITESSSGTSCSLSTQVGSCALVVSRDVTDAGLLNPLTDLVYVRLTVAGTPDVPMFTGRVNTASETSDGQVLVTCTDRVDDLVNHQLAVPWATHTGYTVAQEFTALIQDVDPTWHVDTSTVPFQAVPTLAWDTERSTALQDLADGINCVWRADRVGGFIMFPNPFSIGPSLTPFDVFKDGVNGTLVTVERASSRAQLFNSITVIVERADGSTPIRVTVTDNNPASLTYYGGSFGKRNRNVSIQTPLDAAGARALAVRLLNQVVSYQETWSITMPWYPLLDPGDVIGVWFRNKVSPVVVDSVVQPFAASQLTQVTGRRLILLNQSLIGTA